MLYSLDSFRIDLFPQPSNLVRRHWRCLIGPFSLLNPCLLLIIIIINSI